MSAQTLAMDDVGLNFASTKHTLNVYVQKITPEVAQHLLNSNHQNNRKIKARRVTTYARQMARGLWRSDNGEGISISDSGKLINGQHRLAAIIEYGKPIEVLVFSGIKEEAINSIDDGLSRNLTDAMTIHGKNLPNQAAINGAIKCLMNLKGTTETGLHYESVLSARSYSTSEQIEFFDALPNFRQTAVKFFSTFKYTAVSKVIPLGIALALYYLFSKEDEEIIYSIFKSYETGIPFDNLKELSPSYHAFRRASKARELKIRTRPHEHISIFLWVLAKSLEAKPVSKLPTLTWNWDAKNPITMAAIKKLKALDL